MSTTPGRPSVEQVAVIIRARTKDTNGNEVGTFDTDTRPTDVQVEEQIDASMALVGLRVGALDKVPQDLLPGHAEVVALEAACRIEKSYFPEQVRSDRSNYTQLREEYLEALQALSDAVDAGGGEFVGGLDEVVNLPVGSWTSIPHSWIGRS